MSEPQPFESLAAWVARVARAHPDCLDAAVTDVAAGRAVIALTMNVEMPLAMAAAGHSPNGVRSTEVVEMTISADFPWRDPSFRLRMDFPRELPHLHPTAASRAPRPCLIDGSSQEYFAQFGLAEAGLFHLLHQLADWLGKAAVGDLINHEQGWEPLLRNSLDHELIANAAYIRSLATKSGGWKVLASEYWRIGADSETIGSGALIALEATEQAVALKSDDLERFTAVRTGNIVNGATVIAVIWPDKLPTGEPRIADRYLPETVETLADLKAKAEELGCTRGLTGFLANLERKFSGYRFDRPIPVGIILCARRPIKLIRSSSSIELIPYVIEFRAAPKRTSLFEKGDASPVGPAGHVDAVSPSLMRELSGTLELGSLAILGCGSVGSKIAVHAARAGQGVLSVADERRLRPHNMARHALLPSALPGGKADELAKQLGKFGPAPSVYHGDLVSGLRDAQKAKLILPNGVSAAINTTASIPVREALVVGSAKRPTVRMIEAALVGNGHGAFLLASGPKANPNPCDLTAELYATLEPASAFHRLMFDPSGGLQMIQIGQGCGSMTLRASDVAISAMTAGVTDELWRIMSEENDAGTIVTGIKDEDSPSTSWVKRPVPSFEIIPIEGSNDWKLRISQRVIDEIRKQVTDWPDVETGGVMIGTTSARLKTVTVVDWLDAPADSKRSASEFVLGTAGLEKAIRDRHASSGGTLHDVGTWHSHLMDEGPSSTDWATAKTLAAARVAPAILLITSPNKFYALQALPEESDGGG